ncbi:hypothetical protein BO79DRAFT_64345 [Aspergillus costaricaensis CBS 115574]|uniref:Uncharacterized protein n=1 Tax=Aspergillus costaricaensis CBS 115574 TaxID=1448317 RepID=A0ACD1IPB8_9EURO|nr:hypothetical protein BO79DRAFT_64345 [Aspergillus costaricaensis CBS 115574]RAK92360.1 hypothetical protein BO79DRAFT_64345 [Aspergillus costaricaensis CBS 115574]
MAEHRISRIKAPGMVTALLASLSSSTPSAGGLAECCTRLCHCIHSVRTFSGFLNDKHLRHTSYEGRAFVQRYGG